MTAVSFVGCSGNPRRQGRYQSSCDVSRRSACSVILDIGIERVVVGLVEKVGLAGPLVAKRGEQPREPLAHVSKVDVRLFSREFATKRLDGLAKLPILGAYAADATAKPGLRACDVGEKTVGFLSVSLLFGRRLIEDNECSEDIASPGRFPSRSGCAESSFELVDCLESSVLIDISRLERVTLRGGEMGGFRFTCQ